MRPADQELRWDIWNMNSRSLVDCLQIERKNICHNGKGTWGDEGAGCDSARSGSGQLKSVHAGCTDAFRANWMEKVHLTTDLALVGRDVAKDLNQTASMATKVKPLLAAVERKSTCVSKRPALRIGAGTGRVFAEKDAVTWCSTELDRKDRRAVRCEGLGFFRSRIVLRAQHTGEARADMTAGSGTKQETICYADQ